MNELTKTIYDLELSLLTPQVRSSFDKLNSLLSDDFMEFGSSGLVYNKKEIIERLPSTSEKVEYVMRDFVAQMLSDDVVFATYKTDQIIETGKVISLRSSIWKKINGNWQMFFHQGTPVA